MTPRIYDIDEQELRYLYYTKGMSQKEISIYYGTSQPFITKRMQEFNIKARLPHEISKKQDFGITKKELVRMYIEERMNMKDIGELFGVSHVTVWRRMKEYNIKIRSSGESRTIYDTVQERLEAIKEMKRNYNHSEKGEIAMRNFLNSNKGKEWKVRQRSYRRRLDFMPINEPFDGSEFHHYNKKYGIYIPIEIHRNIRHNIWTGKNMEAINKEAFEFLDYEIREEAWSKITGD